jgi:hypothetical protein
MPHAPCESIHCNPEFKLNSQPLQFEPSLDKSILLGMSCIVATVFHHLDHDGSGGSLAGMSLCACV